MRHEKGTKTAREDYLKSIEEASLYIESNLFRPPYGRLPIRYARKIRKQYKVVMWSWLSYDYDATIETKTILQRAERDIKGGDIIVVHDNTNTTDRLKELLPALIKIIKNKGLEFKVIPN